MTHKKIPISSDKYNVIWALFSNEFKPFSTYSAPEGAQMHPNQGEMMTEWGIGGEDFPLIGNRRTWTINPATNEPMNTVHEYWLCSPELEHS